MPILDLLLSALEDAVIACDLTQGKTIFISPAIQKLTGYSSRHLQRYPDKWMEMIDPIDRHHTLQQIERMKTTDEIQLSYRIIARNKHLKWVQVKIVNFVDDNKHHLQLFIVKDVTDMVLHRKEAEKQISFLESVVNAGGAYIVRLDLNMRYTYVNRALSQFLGYPPDEILGRRSFSLLNSQSDRQNVRAASIRAKQHPGEPVHVNTTWKTKTGELRWFSSDVVAVKNEEGKVTEFQVIGIDRTREVLAVQENNLMRDQLEALINNVEDNIWAVDRKFNVTIANQAAQDFVHTMFGITYTPGMSLKEWTGKDTKREDVFTRLCRKALKGQPFREYVRLKNNKQEYYTREIGFNPIFNDQGKILGIACVSRDMTRQMQTADELKAQNEQLRKIASLMSHELRAPVAGILGLVPILSNADEPEEDHQEALRHINAKAKELDRIIHRIVETTVNPVKNDK